MSNRRSFLVAAGAASAVALASRHPLLGEIAVDEAAPQPFASGSLELQLSPSAPEFLSLNIDGLGKGRRGPSIIAAKPGDGGYTASTSASGGIEFRSNVAPKNSRPDWTFEFSPDTITLTSEWNAQFEPAAMTFRLDLNKVHTTVLGLFDSHNLLNTPALMHLPGQGSIRITADTPALGLTYSSDRRSSSAVFSLPGADIRRQRIVYKLQVTAIYPHVAGIEDNPRFDAFRRNWLDALQLNPSLMALANNTASDTCAFCYYEFADIAALTPPLADGLTALDIVRQTLDRMLAGGFAYGMSVVPDHPTISSDFLPSMVIAAADCVRTGRYDVWLAANYDGIRAWVDSMLATDSDGNGLIKYCLSGNSGTWTEQGTPKLRPSNWWDTIGFAYEDAYANALAYRALNDAAMLANKLGHTSDASRYQAAREKLRNAFYNRFYNPETGILAGWRSADGTLHDYYFLWVNGIAIHYGLVAKPQAEAIMERLLAKMREVGYDKFNMGLPGNLITVPLKDYVHKTPNAQYGGGVRPDNADGFQNYENGGATGSFAFFTLAALYDLGRKAEADKILFPMLDGYGACGFEGRDEQGRSPDWRRWDGTPMGYEGYLTDNYCALLAVPVRQTEIAWTNGYRPSPLGNFEPKL